LSFFIGTFVLSIVNIAVVEKKHKCKRTALYHCVLPMFLTMWKVCHCLYQFWKNISFQVFVNYFIWFLQNNYIVFVSSFLSTYNNLYDAVT